MYSVPLKASGVYHVLFLFSQAVDLRKDNLTERPLSVLIKMWLSGETVANYSSSASSSHSPLSQENIGKTHVNIVYLSKSRKSMLQQLLKNSWGLLFLSSKLFDSI